MEAVDIPHGGEVTFIIINGGSLLMYVIKGGAYEGFTLRTIRTVPVSRCSAK